jgi:hypothetical protein
MIIFFEFFLSLDKFFYVMEFRKQMPIPVWVAQGRHTKHRDYKQCREKRRAKIMNQTLRKNAVNVAMKIITVPLG